MRDRKKRPCFPHSHRFRSFPPFPAFASVLLALFLLVLPVGPAGADDPPPQFDVSLGFDGRCRKDGWAFLVVNARNAGPDLTCVVSVRVPGERTDFARTCDLPRNSTRRLEVPFHPWALVPGPVRVRVLRAAGGGELWSRELSFPAIHMPSFMVFAYGGQERSILPSLATIESPDDPDVVGVHALASGGLCEQARGYESVHALILSNVGDGSISPVQARALAEWVRAGGHLVFVWELGWHPERTLDLEIGPPVRPVGELALARLDAFGQFTGSDLEASGVPAAEVRPGPADRILFACDGKPIVVRRSLGRGRLTWVGLDLSRPMWARWAGMASLWRYVLEIPVRHQEDLRDAGPAAENLQIRATLSQAPGIRWLSPGWLLVFTGAYGLVIGPGLYLFFRNRRKGVPGLLAFPVCVVAFSGVAYAVSSNLRSTQEVSRLLTVADLPGGDGVWQGTTYTMVMAPQNVNLTLRSPRGTTRTDFLHDGSPPGGLVAGLGAWTVPEARWHRLTETTEFSFVARSWVSEYLESDWDQGAEPPVRARLPAGTEALVLENRTGGSLTAVTLLRGGVATPFAEEVGRGTQTLRLAGRTSLAATAWVQQFVPGDYAREHVVADWRHVVLLLMFPGVLPGSDEASPLPGAPVRRRPPIPRDPPRLPDPRLATGERPVVLAWSREWQAPLELAGLKNEPERATLFRVAVEER